MKSNANAFIPAATSGTGGFSAWVQAVAGNNTLTIEAEDFSPQANRRTATYWVQVNGTNRVPGYDFNGNLIDNGSGQTYEWDAENRLVKITYADQTSTEFRYDGQSRRVGITEKDAARVVTSEKRYLWAEGAQPAEERAADGRTVVKQYHAQGEFLPGAVAPLNKVFYTKDHLGSVRELVNGNGTLQTRYDYDLWGGRTKITGTVESEVGYTGHHHHGKSGLMLTWYRAYDPVTGRWPSRDPIGEEGGINLYGYVSNNPVNFWDPLGLYWFRQPWQEPGVIGRDNTMVPPGGPISECIEQYVPAGYTFGQLHDAFVGAATGAGFPDWLVNIPSMPSAYRQALITEVLRSLGILEQPSPLNESTTCE